MIEQRCLSHVRDMVGRCDACKIFGLLQFAGNDAACWRSGGIGSSRRGAASLGSSVHIPLVVVANVGKVMTSFEGT